MEVVKFAWQVFMALFSSALAVFAGLGFFVSLSSDKHRSELPWAICFASAALTFAQVTSLNMIVVSIPIVVAGTLYCIYQTKGTFVTMRVILGDKE